MTCRWLGAAVLVLVAVGCNGDDDDAVESTVPETTAPETVEAATTEASTTTTSTTVEATTTTTVDEEALKAQIAADYARAEQVLEDVGRNPDPVTFPELVATAVVTGSELYEMVTSSIEDRLAAGERLVPGDPDYSDVFVESVELIDGPSSGHAEVTACIVRNQMRIGPDGQPLGGTDVLLAARVRQPMQATTSGWLLSSPAIRVDIRQDMTSCAF